MSGGGPRASTVTTWCKKPSLRCTLAKAPGTISGLLFRQLEPEPRQVVAKEEQVHHLDRTGQGPGDTQHARYFVFAAWILLSLFFLFFFLFTIRAREMAKLLVRSVSLMTHQALQSQNRLLVCERYKTALSFLWLLYKTPHISMQGNILKPHIVGVFLCLESPFFWILFICHALY